MKTNLVANAMDDCEQRRRCAPDGMSEAELRAFAAEGYFTRRTETMDDKMQGLIRHVLTSIGGAFVLMGVMDETTVATVVGAAMTLLGFSWSWMAKA